MVFLFHHPCLADQEMELSVNLPSMTWVWLKYPLPVDQKAPNSTKIFYKSVEFVNNLLKHPFLLGDTSSSSCEDIRMISLFHP